MSVGRPDTKMHLPTLYPSKYGLRVEMRGVAAAQRLALSAFGPRVERARALSLWKKVVALAAFFALNVALFFVPIDYSALGAFAYAGAFLLAFIANATVIVPIPYIPIVAHMAQAADSAALVVVLAALGSALGEGVSWAVGRTQKELFIGHPWYQRLRGFFAHEWRAGLFLFLFAIPLNPVFDVGGLAAGALGISFRTFFAAVLLGRVIRWTIIVTIALGVLAVAR